MSKQSTRTEQITRKLLRQISQAQIEDYQTHLLEQETLKKALKDKTDIVEVIEKSLMGQLDKGFTQEDGDLRVTLEVTTRKATPKYKELFAQIAGPKAVEQAQDAAGVSEYKHVRVVSAKVLVP